MKTHTHRPLSDFGRRHYGQGIKEGRAEGQTIAVLAILETRGLAVSDETRARITHCTDPDLIDTWVRRAVLVNSPEQLFD